MRSVENISQELFDKIRSRVSSIKLGDTDGVQTTDPSQARFFEFQYKHRDMPIGAVTLSLNEEGVLQVYFPNSMVEDVDSSTADAWYGFLKELSKFSARNMLKYETHNVTKERLDKKDYQFLTQRSQDEVMENKMYGTHKKSFLEAGTAKLIIQHSKAVDETKLGARSRNIQAIYIENSEGERFKFANNYLPGARAMARHVSNEGHTRDERGTHIVEIMNEMNNLKTFVRSIKREDYVTDEQNEIIEAATDRYYGLKDTLKTLASANGYSQYFENWSPEEVEEEGDLEDLKTKLTREVYDDRLTDSLPSVRRAMKERTNIKEANMQDLVDFANSDDPIEVYDNQEEMDEIKNYMQFMKNSDLDVQRKNRSILVAIMKYLANNMTNDAAANALSDMDIMDPAQQKMAYQIAKKYLQGKIEVKAKKAKKDLFGKDKPSESAKFEAYEQSMDMIIEGTWALPENEAEAMKIAAMMDKPIKLGDGGDDAANALGGLLGDDELFDDLGEAGDKDPEGDARGIIIGWLQDHVDDYGQKFQETMQMALDKIRADGNDSDITIPRTFGAQQDRGMTRKQADDAYNTSSTQGERMGSNAEDMKEDPNEGRMSDLVIEIDEVFADMEADMELAPFANDFRKEAMKSYNIKSALEKVLPDYIAGSKIATLVGEAVQEEDEATDMITKMKEMAGVGSKAKSNHGIHEGEEGYQLTPRSIVARQMRKLQDIEQG